MKASLISLVLYTACPLLVLCNQTTCGDLKMAHRNGVCCPSGTNPDKIVPAEYTQPLCLDFGSEGTNAGRAYGLTATEADAYTPHFRDEGFDMDDKILIVRRALKPNADSGYMKATQSELESRHPHALSQVYYATNEDAKLQHACLVSGGLLSRPYSQRDTNWFTLSGGSSGVYNVGCLKGKFGLTLKIKHLMEKMTTIENKDPAVLAGEVAPTLYHWPSMVIEANGLASTTSLV